MMSKLITSIAAVGLLAAAAGAAQAADLTWRFRSDYPYTVMLEFYSQDRDHSWPGGGQAFVLDDGAVHAMSLGCDYGEMICYGAWVDGREEVYWGAGLDGAARCDDCCARCGQGDIRLKILSE